MVHCAMQETRSVKVEVGDGGSKIKKLPTYQRCTERHEALMFSKTVGLWNFLPMRLNLYVSQR